MSSSSSKRASPRPQSHTISTVPAPTSPSSSPSKSARSSPKRARPDYHPCPHLHLATPALLATYQRCLSIPPHSRCCARCSRPDDGVSLYACLHCGHLGCLDADRVHLPDHFAPSPEGDEHFIAVSIHTGLLYCWKCQQFVWNSLLDYVYNVFKSSGNGQNEEAINVISEKVIGFTRDAGLKRHCVALRGLYNLGKTCFMNCTLQVILHNPHLFKFFLGVGHDGKGCSGNVIVVTGKGNDKKLSKVAKDSICIACECDSLFVEVRSV